MKTSYKAEIKKILETSGSIENLDCHQQLYLKNLIWKAKDAQNRASQPDGPPNLYDFTDKELQLLQQSWYFCCKWLRGNLYPSATEYGATNNKNTKKNEKALLQRAKEIALAPGTVRLTNIRLSQVIDHPGLKEIVQLAEQDSDKPSISIAIPGFKITALKGRKIIASDENQLQIENPPPQFTIELNATKN